MNKLNIKETIVVEGKHDLERIKSCVNADVITTQGTHLSKQVLDLCKRLNDKQGIIVFTDPDGPGEMIRTKIIDTVGSCKHASLSLKQSRNKTKVGIEHASCEDIVEALKKVASFDVKSDSLSMAEFFELGLNGRVDSQDLRDILSTRLNIPKMNAKRAFKYLNMLNLSKREIEDILTEE